MKLSYILYASLAAINTVMAADHTEICLSNPEATIQAGSVATATIDNPLGKACEATVEFANSDFLPLHFGLKRIRCDGLQLGQITIPLEAPNGDARILWKCTNQAPSCTHVWISGGLASADSIPMINSGELSCVKAGATSTFTSTSTGVSTTATDTIKSTYFTTSSGLLTSSTATDTIKPTYFTTTSGLLTSSTATDVPSTSTMSRSTVSITTDSPVTVSAVFAPTPTTLITSSTNTWSTSTTAANVITSMVTVSVCSTSR